MREGRKGRTGGKNEGGTILEEGRRWRRSFKGLHDSPLPTPVILLPLILFSSSLARFFSLAAFVSHAKNGSVLFPVSAHFCAGFALPQLSFPLLIRLHIFLPASLSRFPARRPPSLSRRAQANTRRQSSRPVLT